MEEENSTKSPLVKRVRLNAVEIMENPAKNVGTNETAIEEPNLSREKSINVSSLKKSTLTS